MVADTIPRASFQLPDNPESKLCASAYLHHLLRNFHFISGSILIAYLTRAWATSISMVLMTSICYSREHARRYYWVYHVYGWLLPISATLATYLISTMSTQDGDAQAGLRKIETLQYSAAIVLLALCIITSSANLLRIARRTYQLKRDAQQSRRTSSVSNEGRPLICNDSDDDLSLRSISTISTGKEQSVVIDSMEFFA